MAAPEDITRLLQEWGGGDADVPDRLFAAIYDELHGLAHMKLLGERPDHTLNTTALVHEAYLKLVRLDHARWQNRAHFFAMAARAMRQVLVNYAIMRKSEKRGSGKTALALEDVVVMVETCSDELLALDQALNRLADAEPRLVRVVECRLFAGMNVNETADALDISAATVKRDWMVARAWLNREMGE